MTNSTADSDAVFVCEHLLEIAAILAQGYLRLIGVGRAVPNETGQSGQNSPEKGPSEALDFIFEPINELDAG